LPILRPTGQLVAPFWWLVVRAFSQRLSLKSVSRIRACKTGNLGSLFELGAQFRGATFHPAPPNHPKHPQQHQVNRPHSSAQHSGKLTVSKKRPRCALSRVWPADNWLQCAQMKASTWAQFRALPKLHSCTKDSCTPLQAGLSRVASNHKAPLDLAISPFRHLV